jgi:hypothetical protein
MKRSNVPLYTHLAIGSTFLAMLLGACSDSKRAPEPVAVASSQQLQAQGARPSFEEFRAARELSRRPRSAPAPVNSRAAQKLAEFERRVSENQASWGQLAKADREQRRAELKHNILNGDGRASGSKGAN